MGQGTGAKLFVCKLNEEVVEVMKEMEEVGDMSEAWGGSENCTEGRWLRKILPSSY